MLKLTGITPEGRPVMAGTAQFAATTGLPLDFLIEELHDRGYAIDWASNLEEVLKQGSNIERALAYWYTINEQLHGQEWANTWKTKMQQLIQWRLNSGKS